MNPRFKEIISNAILIIGWLFLVFYGLYYNSLANIWIMVFAIPFVLFRSLLLGKLKFDINLCFLMETFFIKAMLDQHIGKEAIVPTTMAIPMLMYLFGKLLVADVNEREKESHSMIKTNVALFAMTLGTLILGLLNFRLNRKSPFAAMGFYPVAFTNDTVFTDALSYYFNFIFIGAIVAGALVYLIYKSTNSKDVIIKYRGPILAVVYVVAMAGIVAKYMGTENFQAFKQGAGLMISKHWGNFGFELTYNNSTSNMWLDYGRDYGILVFGTLFVFFILTIKDAIKLAFNKNVGIFTKAFVIVAFTGVNVYYFVDMYAYLFPQYWYVGLVLCGILSELAKVEGES